MTFIKATGELVVILLFFTILTLEEENYSPHYKVTFLSFPSFHLIRFIIRSYKYFSYIRLVKSDVFFSETMTEFLI